MQENLSKEAALVKSLAYINSDSNIHELAQQESGGKVCCIHILLLEIHGFFQAMGKFRCFIEHMLLFFFFRIVSGLAYSKTQKCAKKKIK